jgi:outer membrane receptor protein involved in Fe transport
VDSVSNNLFGNVEQPNPKLGLVWRVTPSTTVRLAAFRGLKRNLLTKQTIEPTQVAGFNQFFDDFTGAEARRYGIAIDQKFNTDLYGGLEFSARELTIPIDSTSTINWDERSYRGYLNWSPNNQLSATIAYQLEEFMRDERVSNVPGTTTHQAEAGVRFFHDSGFFYKVVAQYINQKVVAPDFFDPASLRNQFVIVDAGLGYRLPKRFGIIGIELRNLFNERFNFQSFGIRAIEGSVPSFIPDRTIFAKFTFAF